MNQPRYSPPSPQTMQETQNSDDSLQLLLAQRTLYTKAKKYLVARVLGMFLIAILAPIIGSIWPGLAVACGAIAGAWIFLGRTWLTSKQKTNVDQAAAIQEQFDASIFDIPHILTRENSPSLEDIEKITGGRSVVKKLVRLEKLRDWYHFEADAKPSIAVAAAQRANVSYSDSLLRTTAKVWRGAIICWALVAVVMAFVLHMEVSDFVLVVALPLLPAFLDLVDFSRDYESASYIRRTTATEIEEAIEAPSSLTDDQLLIWQERIYELRRTTPLVPNVIYWLQRKSNESAMVQVVKRLSR